MAETYNGSEKKTALSVSQLKSPSDFQRHFDTLKAGRASLEQQWKLNLAFYRGKQYSYYNKTTRQIESLPVEDGDKPRYRVRLVNNQIMSGSQSLLSKYTKTKPTISASPGTGSHVDNQAAKMASRLLEYWWDFFKLEGKYNEALLWAIIAGNGYWKIGWDEHAGTPMRFTLNPETGEPIVEDELQKLFVNNLKKQGLSPEEYEKIVYMGDLRIEVMSPFNVFLDPGVRSAEDAKFAYCIHNLDPDEVYVRWKTRLEPDVAPVDADETMPMDSPDTPTEKTLRKIYIGYFKPSPAIPDGKYVVWADGHTEFLANEKWPYPTHELPIVKFPGIRVPGRIYDSSVVEHALPIQKELNRTLSQIVEHKNLTIRPQWMAPVNSLRKRMTNEPGAVWDYTPVGNMKPESLQMPVLHPQIYEFLDNLGMRIKDMFSLTEVSEGTLPPNVEAGVAIDLLQEMSTDRMAPTIRLNEKSLEKAGTLMLALAAEYYEEPRMIKIKGPGGSVQVKSFTKSDIAGGVDVDVESGSGLPRTRAGRLARVQSFVEMGVLPAEKAWKFLDLADMKGLAAEFQADEEQAHRIIDTIMDGGVVNHQAVRDAMKAVGSGTNPDTQQPIQSEEEAQDIIKKAALTPVDYVDYDTALTTTGLFMKSSEFEHIPEDIQDNFIMYYQNLRSAMANLAPQPEGQAPRINYQIKGTAGATAASQILQKAGIDVSPETMAETPLETWVTDSMDKPDVDEAGNDQETALDEKMLQMTTASKAVIEAAGARQDATHTAVNQEQSSRHAEEKHAADMEMMKAKVATERARAKQTAKPKTAAKKKK